MCSEKRKLSKLRELESTIETRLAEATDDISEKQRSIDDIENVRLLDRGIEYSSSRSSCRVYLRHHEFDHLLPSKSTLEGAVEVLKGTMETMVSRS
jgi:hypothetical protein